MVATSASTTGSEVWGTFSPVFQLLDPRLHKSIQGSLIHVLAKARSFARLALLHSLSDFILEAPDEPLPPPGLKAKLEDQKQEDIDPHQPPSPPRAHPPDLVAPDLLLVIPA